MGSFRQGGSKNKQGGQGEAIILILSGRCSVRSRAAISLCQSSPFPLICCSPQPSPSPHHHRHHNNKKGEGRRCQACIYHLFSPPHIFQGHFSVRQYFRANLGFQHKNLWVNFKDLSTHRYFYFPMSMYGHNLLGSLLWSPGHNLSKPNQLCVL